MVENRNMKVRSAVAASHYDRIPWWIVALAVERPEVGSIHLRVTKSMTPLVSA